MKTIFVIPAHGGEDRAPLKVRDPFRGDHLPPEGREVPHTTYWQRRLNDGDVVQRTPSHDVQRTPAHDFESKPPREPSVGARATGADKKENGK